MPNTVKSQSNVINGTKYMITQRKSVITGDTRTTVMLNVFENKTAATIDVIANETNFVPVILQNSKLIVEITSQSILITYLNAVNAFKMLTAEG